MSGKVLPDEQAAGADDLATSALTDRRRAQKILK
jgi:hypothetical protein